MGVFKVRYFCFTSLLLCQGCGLPRPVGDHHTSDETLGRIFNERQAEFESLLAEVQADTKLLTIQPNRLIYGEGSIETGWGSGTEVEHLGLPKDRWLHYQRQMAELGLKGGILKGDGAVEFRVDPGTIWNGDSYKGYEYTRSPQYRLLPSLDNRRYSDLQQGYRFWCGYKPLKGNWYLYLFVNG